jgi:hypothetical protein
VDSSLPGADDLTCFACREADARALRRAAVQAFVGVLLNQFHRILPGDR